MNTHAAAHARAKPTTRESVVNIRARRQQIDLIDRAAAALGQNRSGFMLDTAVRAAESVLLDKRLFTVDEATFDRFMARLDAPPQPNPALRKLLGTKAPWEK